MSGKTHTAVILDEGGEILRRLDNIDKAHTLISSQLTQNCADTHENRAVCHEIRRCLMGDLSPSGKPGLLTRVDRMEQDADKQKWISRAALTAAVAAVIHAIGSLIFRK